MRHRTKPRKALIIGSGALQIGQAGEFDYSGSQAIKALKDDGIATVLINPNIATIQTSEHLADAVYFLPLTAHFVERIIEKEQPDALILSVGGQVALNLGVELYKSGALERHGVKVLGTPVETIEKTEDRYLFAQAVHEAGFKTARYKIVTSVDGAVEAAREIGYPVMVRIAYALGGLGSGVVEREEDLLEKARRAFSFTGQIIIEESLHGWKEVEYEIVRDGFDNCITVCSMENLDPMGIHTGDSVVVAPVQTLTARENFKLRSIGMALIRRLGIVGECNIQYALDPESEDYRIIEVNARLSRSSALASKATGYPLAYVSTKLALGYALNEIENVITRETSACFEPALDYVVVKFPRWDLQKFRKVSTQLGSEMKSVGEVMAIGRRFEEALQKAIRMLDIGLYGLTCNDGIDTENMERDIREGNDRRVFLLGKALEQGVSVQTLHEWSKITPWFLEKMKRIIDLRRGMENKPIGLLAPELLMEAKRSGYSDSQIARLTGSDKNAVRVRRIDAGIVPYVKQIDTLAAEFPARTNYLYMTYNAAEHDIEPSGDEQIVVLGGGAYRIGSSVEFDWCCVNTVMALEKLGYKSIMVNYNPETVSTDHDTCDKLYFEEISMERVMDIYDFEQPHGVVVSVGGQVPNTLAMKLHDTGVRILGTSPVDIDRAEDRHKFSRILDEHGIDQPEWEELTDLAAAKRFAQRVGYPVLIRPSYVLSGAAMSTVLSEDELEEYLQRATDVSPEHPVVMSKFITDAREIEVDAIGDGGELFCYAISEHVENAGVHSGDATLVLPPQRTYLETMRQVKGITKRIARAMNITGPFNIQFIAKDNEVKVIECNLRASRSFPFVSKVLKINFIDIATRVMLGEKVKEIGKSSFDLDYVGVKASHFSFTRLKGSDPVLGVEMSSTGEVACLGDDFHEAFLKSVLATTFRMPERGVLLSTGGLKEKTALLEEVRTLHAKGLTLYGTPATAAFYADNGIPVTPVERAGLPAAAASAGTTAAASAGTTAAAAARTATATLDTSDTLDTLDKKDPNATLVRRSPAQPDEGGTTLSIIESGKIDLVINIPKTTLKEELDNDYLIRRKAVDLNIPLITNVQVAQRFIKAIRRYKVEELGIKAWEEYE